MQNKIIKILNTRIKYYSGGLIIYRKNVKDNNIFLDVRFIYLVGVGEHIISNDVYELEGDVTLNSILDGYELLVDEMVRVSKNNN